MLVLTLLTTPVTVVLDMVGMTVQTTWMYVATRLPVRMVEHVPTPVPMAITASAYQATQELTVTCQMVCKRQSISYVCTYSCPCFLSMCVIMGSRIPRQKRLCMCSIHVHVCTYLLCISHVYICLHNVLNLCPVACFNLIGIQRPCMKMYFLYIDLCVGDPCENGGGCLTQATEYVCICAEGYDGETCELDIDVCGHIQPCRNNATCLNTGPNTHQCLCQDGFSGRQCELEIATNKGSGEFVCFHSQMSTSLHTLSLASM